MRKPLNRHSFIMWIMGSILGALFLIVVSCGQGKEEKPEKEKVCNSYLCDDDGCECVGWEDAK